MLENFKQLTTKKIVIKLGGSCNLSCPHCHCEKVEYEYNPDIIDYIKSNDFNIVFFSGGEPLLYFEIIKNITNKLGSKIHYFLTTSGVGISKEHIEFFNKNNFTVYLSYDGEQGARDYTSVDFSAMSNIHNIGYAVCFYPFKNNSLQAISYDIRLLSEQYGLPDYFFPNFAHQTANNYLDISNDFLEEYIRNICTELELDFIDLVVKQGNRPKVFLRHFINLFIAKNTKGVRCCGNQRINMAINGDILLCPYSQKVVGNIVGGISWDKVASYIPQRCTKCALFSICENTCVENITENECIIFKTIYRHFNKLKDKYHAFL